MQVWSHSHFLFLRARAERLGILLYLDICIGRSIYAYTGRGALQPRAGADAKPPRQPVRLAPLITAAVLLPVGPDENMHD